MIKNIESCFCQIHSHWIMDFSTTYAHTHTQSPLPVILSVTNVSEYKASHLKFRLSLTLFAKVYLLSFGYCDGVFRKKVASISLLRLGTNIWTKVAATEMKRRSNQQQKKKMSSKCNIVLIRALRWGPKQQIVLLGNAIYSKRMLKANELCLTK